MATRGIAHTIPFVAWDTTNNVGKTGDSANFTMRWVKDGTSAALTVTTVTEIDSTNAPGLYTVGISSTEAGCNIGVLAGKSSTANISIMPVLIQFERLPDAAPAASGGLATCDASNTVKVQTGTGTGQLDFTSGRIKADVAYWNAAAIATPDTAGYPKVTIKSGTGTGEISLTSGKPAVTLASTDVTGNVAADVQTVKTQTVTCAAGITVSAFVGNATAALSVDASGRIDIGKALGTVVTLDANNVLNVSSKYWAGTAITATSIPVATAAGAAGGLMIAGSNAATTYASMTVTGALTVSNGIAVTCSTSNRDALSLAGNGTGSGLVSVGGATGYGASISGGATSGDGLIIYAQTSGDAVNLQAAGTSRVGIRIVGGSTSGEAIRLTTVSGNAITISPTGGHGIEVNGNSSYSGLEINAGATGHGLAITGGATSGDAIALASTSGNAISCISSSGHGAVFQGGGTSGSGMVLTRGGASGDDMKFTNGDVTIGAVTLVNGLAADIITAASIASDAGTEIATAVWSSGTRTLSAATNITSDGNSIPITVTGYVDANVRKWIDMATPSYDSNGFPNVNIAAIDQSVEAAQQQSRAARVVFNGVVDSATTTTITDNTLTQSDTNHWVGRVVIILTGSLKYQATDITAFDASTDTITFTALTNAPSTNDEFIIV